MKKISKDTSPVYSESDFETFSKAVTEKAVNIADSIVKEALKKSEEKIEKAREEAQERYTEDLENILKEATAFRKMEEAKIESELRISIQKEFAAKREMIIKRLEKKIEERFESIANCFLSWIAARFESGKLELYDKLEIGEEFVDFTIERISEKRIGLKNKNLVIEFTPQAIIEEFSHIIDDETGLALKVGI